MSDDVKCRYLRKIFPEEVTMLHIQDQEFAQGGVEAEKALRSFADEWSCLEMLDEKLKCLKSARNLGELSIFIVFMTSKQPPYQKLYQSWKLSQPKPSDSLVHWGDLLAYRQNFLLLIDQHLTSCEPSTQSQHKSLRSDHLADIKKSLIDVAFAQKNCDAAKFMINGLADDILANPTEEKRIKHTVAVGKYSLIAAEQKSTTMEAQIKRLCNGLRRLIDGVIEDDAAKQFPEAKIESFCCVSEISIRLWKAYEKCNDDNRDSLQQRIMMTINAIDDDSDVTDHLLRFAE